MILEPRFMRIESWRRGSSITAGFIIFTRNRKKLSPSRARIWKEMDTNMRFDKRVLYRKVRAKVVSRLTMFVAIVNCLDGSPVHRVWFT